MKSCVKKHLYRSQTGQRVWEQAIIARRFAGDLFWYLERPLLIWAQRRSLLDAPPPLLIGGTGGSGTRVVARIAELAGIFMGTYLNNEYDAMPTVLRYSNKWSDCILYEGADFSLQRQRKMDQDLQAAFIKHRRGIAHPDSPWGAKNPRFIYFLPHLHRFFPKLKFIHVIRDGRDMAFSKNQFQLDQVGGRYLIDLNHRLKDAPRPVRSIALWSSININVSNYGAERLKDGYLSVRLEDLCADPTPTIRKIFSFLGVNDHRLTEAKAEVKTPYSLGRWKGIDPALLDKLHAEGEGGLKKFGYLET
jgi:hypothetical protein